MNTSRSEHPVIVAGGSIGGLAAALAITRQGFRVKVLESAPEIGEIGAGIQPGPNAFARSTRWVEVRVPALVPSTPNAC